MSSLPNGTQHYQSNNGNETVLKNYELPTSISRKRKHSIETVDLSVEEKWKRRKSVLLSMLNDINPSFDKTSNPTPGIVNVNEMRDNVLLMRGELPTSYQKLKDRFHGADIYIRHNSPNESILKDIHNYLSLSDLKLSFTEDHVKSIVFFYGYKEKHKTKKEAYVLGRVRPRTKLEYSYLTLRLPVYKRESTHDQIQSFLSSRKNLNALFDCMAIKKDSGVCLTEREKQLNGNIELYVTDCYKKYLERTKQKECQHGRVAGFSMMELGEMPKGFIPKPIVLSNHSADEVLAKFQRDVCHVINSKDVKSPTCHKEEGKDRLVDLFDF